MRKRQKGLGVNIWRIWRFERCSTTFVARLPDTHYTPTAPVHRSEAGDRGLKQTNGLYVVRAWGDTAQLVRNW